MCEAYKRNKPVRDSVCVIRSDQGGRFWILMPCGFCQERLFACGLSGPLAVWRPKRPNLRNGCRRAQSHIAQVTIVPVARAGHVIQFDHPDAVAEAVRHMEKAARS